ncbi:hypothetical protein MMSR116_29130 [Methylobacterium mesophilicum SR1.6/6]|uniref:Ribosomal protein S27 n=1 Tax=Methylobacterium mesophilicum SR1.6/6 TaxID=908290 RepID=A0A6B9FS45_9HYPH|nr:hypothetical protein [Methylobacterium mesophilicum]QGY05503.1 hypothetical protein MMSR116_29130 [Methylobacterium mesophilicum SR1.6/6]
MNTVFALILVCAASTAQPECTRETALNVATIKVPSVFACLMTGQTTVAREELLGDGRYTKVECGGRP